MIILVILGYLLIGFVNVSVSAYKGDLGNDTSFGEHIFLIILWPVGIIFICASLFMEYFKWLENKGKKKHMIFDRLEHLVNFAIVAGIILFPLGIWKLIEIIIWVINHIHIG